MPSMSIAEESALSGRFVVSGSGPDYVNSESRKAIIWRSSALNVIFWVKKQTPRQVIDRSKLTCARLSVFSVVKGTEHPVDITFRATWLLGPLMRIGYTDPEWYSVDSLEPGQYILRVNMPRDSNIQVSDNGEFPFEIVEPTDDKQRFDAKLSVMRMYLELGELEKAETIGFGLLDKADSYGSPFDILSDIYSQVGLHKRALEFEKECMRHSYIKIAAGDNMFFEVFAIKALAAGVVDTKKEGIALYEELMKKLSQGENTGKLPEELLHPVLSKQLQTPTEDSPAQPPAAKE
jgi:hypothetical protein